MNRIVLLLIAGLLGADFSVAQDKVQANGISAAVKLEETVSGNLTELNGKYKLRATEVTFAPGALLDAHHHAGPGLRKVLNGELTFVQAGKTTVYKAGDYFFESGNVVHTAQNRTKAPVRVVFFEVLPVTHTGPSVIPPKAY